MAQDLTNRCGGCEIFTRLSQKQTVKITSDIGGYCGALGYTVIRKPDAFCILPRAYVPLVEDGADTAVLIDIINQAAGE